MSMGSHDRSGLDPELSTWRDTHVRLDGPVVTRLQSVIVGD